MLIVYMGAVVKQHWNSDGHKSKSRAISFSSLLDKFGLKAKGAGDVAVSEELRYIMQSSTIFHTINLIESKIKTLQGFKNWRKTILWSNQVRGICYKCSWQISSEVVINNLKQREPPLFFVLQTDASNHENMFNILMWKSAKLIA